MDEVRRSYELYRQCQALDIKYSVMDHILLCLRNTRRSTEIASNPRTLHDLFCHGRNRNDLSLPSQEAHNLPGVLATSIKVEQPTLETVPASVLPSVATS